MQGNLFAEKPKLGQVLTFSMEDNTADVITHSKF